MCMLSQQSDGLDSTYVVGGRVFLMLNWVHLVNVTWCVMCEVLSWFFQKYHVHTQLQSQTKSSSVTFYSAPSLLPSLTLTPSSTVVPPDGEMSAAAHITLIVALLLGAVLIVTVAITAALMWLACKRKRGELTTVCWLCTTTVVLHV